MIFNIGDNVIGVSYPDLIPAKVIEIVNEHFVKIEFFYKNKKMESVIGTYRLKLL